MWVEDRVHFTDGGQYWKWDSPVRPGCRCTSLFTHTHTHTHTRTHTHIHTRARTGLTHHAHARVTTKKGKTLTVMGVLATTCDPGSAAKRKNPYTVLCCNQHSEVSAQFPFSIVSVQHTDDKGQQLPGLGQAQAGALAKYRETIIEPGLDIPFNSPPSSPIWTQTPPRGTRAAW